MHEVAPQHVVAELVGQLLLHFFNLPIFSIVPQSPGHLLISHFFAIPLLNTPAVGQSFLVFGGELEDALVLVHPPDTVAHVAVSKQVEEELVQANFPLVACIERNLACFSETQKLFFGDLADPVCILTSVPPEGGVPVLFKLILPVRYLQRGAGSSLFTF